MRNYKKAKITLTNDYHNTETTIWARIPAGSDQVLITPDQAKSAKKRLCGISSCTCSDDVGTRPSQSGGANPNGGLVEIFVTPEKVLDGFYKSEWVDGTGRLIK